jgi:hypothetical protein
MKQAIKTAEVMKGVVLPHFVRLLDFEQIKH